MYADWAFYTGVYGGTLIPQTEYSSIALWADEYVDNLTLYQIDTTNEAQMRQVKLASCAVADVVFRQETAESGGVVASESVGNHSISYLAMAKNDAQRQLEMLRAARLFLARTGLVGGALR